MGEESDDLIVLRCMTCGDTFPIHEGDERRCPSCGGRDLEVTGEPLL